MDKTGRDWRIRLVGLVCKSGRGWWDRAWWIRLVEVCGTELGGYNW